MKRTSSYDVIVVGGGAAGVAAAIGAVKAGASCLLIDRNGCLGGQATNSNVASYCGFFTHGDEPQQIIRGIGQEVLDMLQELGAYDGFVLSPAKNAIITFDEEKLKYTLDLLVQKYDLDVLLHCWLIGAELSEDKQNIIGIECVDDENRYEFKAGVFVDATGDGNLAHCAGAQIRYGDGTGGGYMSTKMMRIDQIDPNVKFSPLALEKIMLQAKQDGYQHLTKESGIVFRTAPDTVYAILPSVAVPALDAATMTACEMNTRKQCQEYLEVFRRYMKGMEHARLVSTGYKLGLRDTRHIIGEYTLSSEEVLNAVKHEDAIARGAWPCEMHNYLNKMPSYQWVKDDDYYEIPLRTLKSCNIRNLWCGGRLISADPIAFASVRVMGIAFGTGHAAGVAAALQQMNGVVNAAAVREELKQQGAVL